MTNIPQEVVERMIALVRDLTKHADKFREIWGCEESNFMLAEGTTLAAREAREIAALLPEPVDPDLIEARVIAGDAMTGWGSDWQTYASGAINAVRTGNDDRHIAVVAARAALKRGRELASGDRS